MTVLKSIVFCLFFVAAVTVSMLPLSNCLGNCMGCSLQSPHVCLNQVRQDTGQTGRCIPFYGTPNCSTSNSFYNVYAENGALNNFVNWSSPAQPSLQQCPLTSSSPTVVPSGIGPFNSTFPAQKNLQFAASQGVTQLLVKIAVAVSDSRLLSTNNNISQAVQQYEQNGTIYIVTTSTVDNATTTNTSIPFIVFTLTNLLANNAVLLSSPTAYQNASLITTKCGSIYQYQFIVSSPSGTVFQQLSLQLALPANSPSLWWLLDFRVQAGCSGFAVGQSCSTCLTGFYPLLTFDGYPNGCPHCPYACATCATAGCLTCEPYATYNATSYSCYYPSSYALYNSTQGYKLVIGTALNNSNSSTSTPMFTQVYKSQNRVITFDMQLVNNQSYFSKMYLVFPISYIENNVNFNITIDGTTWTAANLNNNLATLSNINNAQGLLYVLPFRIDRMGANDCYSNGQIKIQLNTNSVTDQFYLADLTIVQYQCSKNCLKCSFNLAQTTACTLCGPFYELTTNCLTCANGFFEIANATASRCVKCYSNCKQCLGPSNYQCTQCFPRFSITDYSFNTSCINTALGRNPNPSCRFGPTLEELKSQSNCASCLNKNKAPDVYTDPNCISCWLNYKYAWGRCGPNPNSGLSFYSSDVALGKNSNRWTGNGITSQSCTSDYPDLQGIANSPNNTNHTTPVPSQLDFSLKDMPPHLGFSFVVTLLKVDYWAFATDPNNRPSLTPLALNVVLNSPNSPAHSFTVPLSNSFGANICQQSSNEMIWTFQGFISDHSASQSSFSVLSPDKGIFVRQLEIYLANCPSCSNVQLAYALTLLPAYSDNNTQTGVDTYVTFNNPVSYTDGGSPEALANSYTFTVNGERVSNAILTQNKLGSPDYNYLKYFLPLNASYINATVSASTNQAGTIFTQNAGPARQLAQAYQTAPLQRYQNTSPDVRLSVSQLSQFFNFFQWFTIITMIVAAGLGVGVVFEQFSMMMQLIYYHIYITSWLLPSSVKIPLAHAPRLQHLNYFGDINKIETNLFGNGSLIPSNYIYTQYNIDIYFLRSIYPVLIINAILIGWFLILKVLELTVTPFRNSPNRLVRFLRSIPSRPLAYFDQLWRYQYLTVMWACMLQFTNFTGDGSLKVNLACCVLAFIIDFVWPIFTTIYTYKLHFTTNVKHFLYLYHDMYYLKTPSLCDQPKSYLYYVLRAIRLLAYAVFIALFVNQSVIGPVLLIFFNLVDAAVAYFLNIYRTSAYLLTRLLQNALLIVAAILCLVFYGFADSATLDYDSYQNIGFGLSTVFVLMVINGLVRMIYLIYKKVQEWSMGTYDVGQRGQLQNFDDKSPVKLAQQSERIQMY